MTTVSADTAMFQAKPVTVTPPRPVHRTHEERFETHLAESAHEATASPAQDEAAHTVAALPLEDRLGTASVIQLVPLHLRSSTGQADRVYAWGLHVNGYLSDLHASRTGRSDQMPDAALPRQDGVDASTAPAVSGAAGDLPATPGASGVAQLTGASASVAWTPSTGGSSPGEPSPAALPTSAALQTEPFQRTLVRWAEGARGRALYLRDFRLSHADINELAARLRQWFTQTDSGPVRIVINGHAQPNAHLASSKEHLRVR